MERIKNITEEQEAFEHIGTQTNLVKIDIEEEGQAPLFTETAFMEGTEMPLDVTLFDKEDLYATSILFYIKSGKKYWVIGDSHGGVSMHMFNGTFVNRGLTNKGHVNSLDRFGQSLIFATDKNVGVFDLNAMETQTICDGSTSKINSVLIDQTRSSNIVYGAMDNGDIIVFDTRHENSRCKAVAKFGGKATQGSLGVVRGRLINWDGESMTIFNTTFLDTNLHSQPVSQRIQEPAKLPVVLNYRTQGGNVIGLASANAIRIYDVVNLGPAPAGDFIGNYRFLIIGFAIAVKDCTP